MQSFLMLSVLATAFSPTIGVDTSGLTNDLVQSRIAEQVILFPQEKLYLQTDKPDYVLGESIWFRAHLVDATLHTPTDRGPYVYLELVNPLDSVVSRMRVKQSDGVFSGSLALPETLAEGNYVLRAYTDNLRNLDNGYFFHRNVQLLSPFSDKHEVRASFESQGETVRASLSLWDRESGARVVPSEFTVWLSDRVPKKLRSDSEGTASMSFRHPRGGRERFLYVETPTFGKYIPIPHPESAYEVSFYPEGGYLLEGVKCRVAFKALHADGSPAEINGRLVDGDGVDHGPVETLHAGMGLFHLAAAPGKHYTLVCEDGRGGQREFELPQARNDTYALQANTVDGELHLSVLGAPGVETAPNLYLLLHTRGMVHYMAPWDTAYAGFAFETSHFPSGVVQILLLDEQANPLSERLYFCRNDDDAKLSFRTDQASYAPRSRVKAAVGLADDRGRPLSGSFSVSVTDDLDVSPDSTIHILSSLLLGSELKGFIPNLSYYFEEGNSHLLDLLMLTHGWRRYNIPDAIGQRYAHPTHPIRHGMEIRGTVKTDSRGRPAAGNKVSLYSWNTDYSEETVTDDTGSFVFDGIEFPDSLTFVVQAETSKRWNNLVLDVEEEAFPPVSEAIFDPTPKTTATDVLLPVDRNTLVEKANRQYAKDHGMRRIRLDEVSVSARRVGQREETFSHYMPRDGIDVMNAEDLEKIQPGNVSDIIMYLPFVDVMEDPETYQKKAVIERMKTGFLVPRYASLVIDDMVINDYDLDNIIDPSNIEKIGVLKGPAAAILGGDGAGGAIVITTRRGGFRDNRPPLEHIKWVTPLGFREPAEFYSPRYETAAQRNGAQGDFRTTIYWNPDVKVPDSGKAEFDFYTADANTTYSVVIEGVADNGMLVRYVYEIIRK